MLDYCKTQKSVQHYAYFTAVMMLRVLYFTVIIHNTIKIHLEIKISKKRFTQRFDESMLSFSSRERIKLIT